MTLSWHASAAQCNATETDDASAVQDVFSAGCVLAEMFLDGKLLFDRPQVHPHILLHALPAFHFQIELCV